MTAERLDADVVIVGSGIAGSMVACGLVRAGIRTIVLEGGPEVTRAELHERFLETKVYRPTDLDPRVDYAPTTDPDDPDAYFINTGNNSYNIHMSKMLGGTTWHWSGGSHRLLDVDFRLKSTYGVGIDWPIDYADLEPWYSKAEHEIGVSAPTGDPVAKRRSVPTPMSDFAWPYMYVKLKEILAPHGYDLNAGSHARNSMEYDNRPACRGNNTCWPLCPIGAQYGAIFHLDKARALGAEVRVQSLAVRIETDDDNKVRQIIYRKPDGSQETIRAKLFVLAANGLECPKLLLASSSERAPEGLANTSGQVGRNLMDHPTVNTAFAAKEPVFGGRGPISFGQVNGTEDGPFRSHRAAASLAFDNRISVDEITLNALRKGLSGDALEREIRFRSLHTCTLASEVEMLPDPASRITLDWDRRDSAGQPRMRINLNFDDYTLRSLDHIEAEHDRIMDIIGVVDHTRAKARYFSNHPSGTTRMGLDPKTSVLDRDCRAHDHANLFVVSSSVMPTSGGPAGPTLTIAALALRAASAIEAQLTDL